MLHCLKGLFVAKMYLAICKSICSFSEHVIRWINFDIICFFGSGSEESIGFISVVLVDAVASKDDEGFDKVVGALISVLPEHNYY